MVNTIKFIKNGLVKRNKLVLKKKRKLLFFVIPTVLKYTSGKDLNHEARKEVTKLAKGVRESP